MRLPFRTAPTLAGLGLALGSLVACTASSPGPVPPPSATGSAPTATQITDFDGDGSADVVIGAVGSPASVQVRYADDELQTITRGDLDGSSLNTRFGVSILARDLDGDGFTDLAIGDRGNDTGNEALFLVPGSADGLRAASARRYDPPSGVGRFGSALALVEDPVPVLVVGAPADVEGGYIGGAIVTYRLGADGLPRSYPEVLTQGSPGVPAKAEPGDRFGESLAASGSLLLVGAPLEDVGAAAEAGAVIALTFTHYGLDGAPISKSTAGVAGTVAPGDFFGVSVSIGDGYAAVGVPGQDVGSRKDVGRIQPFRVTDGALAPLDPIDQDSPGVPDSSEPGDAFGTSVAVVRPCPGVVGALAGAPAEGLRGARTAGAAWLVPFTRTPDCPARQFSGAQGLGARPMAGKRIGTGVAALRGSDAAVDRLLVAGPGDATSGGGTVYLVTPAEAGARELFTSVPTPYGITLSPAR